MCTHDQWWRAGWTGRPGEVFERRLTPDHREILEWIGSLPGAVAAVYEAGPTGFGLARFPAGGGDPVFGGGTLEAAAPVGGSGQDRCPRRSASGPVAASGPDRGGPDPQHPAGSGPGLVRAREDCRGDRSVRDIGYRNCFCGMASSITADGHGLGVHELWLRKQRFYAPGLQLAYDAAFDADAGHPGPPDRARSGDHRDGRRFARSPRRCVGWAACAGFRR